MSEPSKEAMEVAREWREKHLGHFMDSKELGLGGEDSSVDVGLAAMLDSLTRRARHREAQLLLSKTKKNDLPLSYWEIQQVIAERIAQLEKEKG